MNLTRFAIENRTLTNFLVFLVVVGGLYSYFQLGQLEDLRLPDREERADHQVAAVSSRPPR
mgnify:CR=1 FL=1